MGPIRRGRPSAANALANAYAKYNVELKLKGARDALSWLTEEAGRLRVKVEESSQALQNYRVKTGILGMQEQRQITASKIMDFNKAFLEAQAQRLSLESKLEQLDADRQGAGRRSQTIFTVADNPLIDKLKGEAATLETERSKLLKVYKDKHPEILKIDAQIQQVKQRLDAEFQNTLQAVQTQYKVAKAREDTLAQPGQSAPAGGAAAEREGDPVPEPAARGRVQPGPLRVGAQAHEGDRGGRRSRGQQRADHRGRPRHPPSRSDRERRGTWWLSIVAGLVLAFGVAFALEYLDTTVKTPDDVERYLGLVGDRGRPRVPRQATLMATHESRPHPHHPDPVLITLTDPKSAASEAFRTLRTNIQFAGLDQPVPHHRGHLGRPRGGEDHVGGQLRRGGRAGRLPGVRGRFRPPAPDAAPALQAE